MDVGHEINSVERTVGARKLAAGTARTVTLTRVFDSPIAETWAACTERERIQRWFVPVSGDLRVGGRFQVEGTPPAPSRPATRREASPPRGRSLAR